MAYHGVAALKLTMKRSGISSFLNWSMRVGHLFGIPIDLHISLVFFLLPLIGGRGLGFGYTLEYIVGVVGSILLHELGHALTAKRFRLTGLSITLHGFGGFATSSGVRRPRESLLISLAGPAVTFVLGFLLLGIGALGRNLDLGSPAFVQFFLLTILGQLNLLMGVLNMVPSLPFDGGHALQAILNHRIPEFKAMRAVGHVGLVFSPILFLYGMFTGQNFVAIFGLMGLITSLMTLLSSGGIRFGEATADRKVRQEDEAARKRSQAKSREYLDDVNKRQKDREERERLRKLFESSLDDE